MADQDFTHTAEIIKAALPFVDSKARVSAELFIKIFDLFGSIKTMTPSDSMAACGFESSKVNLEGLLTAIRPLSNDKEGEFIDRILNIFNAKRMFEMYNNLMSTMKTMQEYGGFPFTDSENTNDTETVTGNFKGSPFESIFGGNFDNSSQAKEADSDSADNAYESFYSDRNEEPSNSSNTEETGSKSTFGNNSMFEMLKAMVPPEQLSTFENFSMLLNTMTYDNNNKPDDGKESNNG